MPAKPLNPEQRADAERLKSAWNAYKLAHPGVTQEWLADQCGWKTQAAVNQYLLGKIPLNLVALLKFAAAIGAAPGQISPSLARQLADAPAAEAPSVEAKPQSPGIARLLKVLEGLDDGELMTIAKAIEALRKPKAEKANKVVSFSVGTPAAGKARSHR